MDRVELSRELLRATELLASGDVDGALALMGELETRASAAADQAEIWARYATLFDMLELPGEAQGAVARALMLDDKNARAHYLDGVHKMVDGEFDEAARALHRAAAYYPPSDTYHLAEVYGNLGYCHSQLGDEERAEAYWGLAEEMDPGAPPPAAPAPEPAPERPPEGCGALERVEQLLRKAGVLKEGDTLFEEAEEPRGEGGPRGWWEEDEPSDVPDDFWRIDDEDEDAPPAPAPRAQAAPPARAGGRPPARGPARGKGGPGGPQREGGARPPWRDQKKKKR